MCSRRGFVVGNRPIFGIDARMPNCGFKLDVRTEGIFLAFRRYIEDVGKWEETARP